MTQTDVSIIIITKNQRDFLQQTIPAIFSQLSTTLAEIIVVDSGSTDGAIEYLKTQDVNLIQIPSENFRHYLAFDKGATAANGRFLIRLSGDCIPQGKNWLQELLNPFQKYKNIGAVYSKYIISGKKDWGYPDFWPEKRFPKKETVYHVMKYPFMGTFEIFGRQEIFNLAGGCFVICKDIYDIRGFNPRLIYGEDAEYAWFLHTVGLDVVCNPQSQVLHEHKIGKGSGNSIIKLSISKWNFIFYMEVLNYWINWLFGKDEFKQVREYLKERLIRVL